LRRRCRLRDLLHLLRPEDLPDLEYPEDLSHLPHRSRLWDLYSNKAKAGKAGWADKVKGKNRRNHSFFRMNLP
jgi:hypothetical protein